MTATVIEDKTTKDEKTPLVKDEKPKDKQGEKPAESIDFDKWLDEQPTEIKDALAERSEKTTKGLKSALDKEREARRESDRKRETEERESLAAKEAKLKEDGKYKEILDSRDEELAKLRAREEARVFRDETRQALEDNDMADFAEILMGPSKTVSDIIGTGEKLREMIDERVETEVAKRLNTGKVPKGGGTPLPTSIKHSEMTQDQKLAFIKEHGADKFDDLIEAERVRG